MIDKTYEQRLIDIDGIGKKTTKKILKEYPTEEELIIALTTNPSQEQFYASYRDDHVDLLIKEFCFEVSIPIKIYSNPSVICVSCGQPVSFNDQINRYQCFKCGENKKEKINEK